MVRRCVRSRSTIGELDHIVVTPHGLRATFRTWGEDVGFPRELLEEALGHQIGTAVERAYRRTDSFERRRTVMQAWADFCHGKPFRAPMA